MLRLAALLLAFAPLALHAQNVISYNAAGENMIAPGLPFHAERVTRSERKLSDDSMQTREEHETIDRDSKGRVMVESKILTSGEMTANNPPVFHEMLDPVTGVATGWSTLSTTAVTHKIPPGVHVRIDALPFESGEQAEAMRLTGPGQPAPEDLGKKAIAGMNATGKRTTLVIAPGRLANVKTLLFTEEVWVSTDLQINLLEIQKSAFVGTRTATVTAITRADPPASLFHVPDGYVIKPAQPAPISSAPAAARNREPMNQGPRLR